MSQVTQMTLLFLQALVLMIFTVVFALFTFAMHKAFGWWIFTWFRLSSDGNSEENPPKTHSSQLRCKRINLTTSLSHDLAFLISCVVYYRNYQIAMQTAQLVILFSVSLPLQLALICNLFIH